jgi:hypothetical protein
MNDSVRSILAAAAVLAAAACGDLSTANRNAPVVNPALDVAFATVPAGFTLTENSFDSSAAPVGSGWFPRAPMGGMGRQEGPMIGAGLRPMIGGGLGGDFLGGSGLGRGFGHGRLGDQNLPGSNCAFVAATGRVTCAPVTRGGLTIVSSVAYADAAGAVQSAFDSLTTNSINTRISVTGTQTRRDSSTSTVDHSSTRTVTGLAKGSTQHTVNGDAQGSETTSGKDSAGTFVAVRTAADTTRGVIVPISDAGRAFPTAGTIIRSMSVSLTYAGKPAQTSTRREVVTYDGSNTAQLVITQNGTTKTCTLPLPFGRPVCQ